MPCTFSTCTVSQAMSQKEVTKKLKIRCGVAAMEWHTQAPLFVSFVECATGLCVILVFSVRVHLVCNEDLPHNYFRAPHRILHTPHRVEPPCASFSTSHCVCTACASSFLFCSTLALALAIWASCQSQRMRINLLNTVLMHETQILVFGGIQS